MRIKMLSGQFVNIDCKDYETVSKYNWSIGSNGYPKRQFRLNGKVKTEYLHRFLLKPKKSQHVDHVDGNKKTQNVPI